MKVRVGREALNYIKSEASYYKARDSMKVAEEVSEWLLDALPKAGLLRGSWIDDMPRTYRRMRVKGYHLYYRVNRQQSYALIFLIRGDRQRPPTPSQLRKHAAQAEHDSIELN
jgi:plasmid stabilization system protein ParE